MTKVISLNERRKYPRVSDALALKFVEAGNQSVATPDVLGPLPTHIVQLSCGGLRFCHTATFENNTSLLLTLHLPSADKTVQLESRVIASGEEKPGNIIPCDKPCFVQVVFKNIDNSVQKLLEDHVDYVIEKTGVKNRAVAYSA